MISKSFLSNPAFFAFVFSVPLSINILYTFLKTAEENLSMRTIPEAFHL